jgi:hypothetical protein
LTHPAAIIEPMTTEMTVEPAVAQATNPRSAAVAELLGALEELTEAYRALPDSERAARCAADADRITAEVARHLFAARNRLGSC